jgi:hypothetical protein
VNTVLEKLILSDFSSVVSNTELALPPVNCIHKTPCRITEDGIEISYGTPVDVMVQPSSILLL